MSRSEQWFEVSTLGSRGMARARPATLATGGVQVEFRFAVGRGLTVTFTAAEAGELIGQVQMALESQGEK